MIAGSEINLREILGTSKLIKQIIDPWQGVLVLDGDCVQVPVIDDNSTKIWKLSSFGFMLLAQAILPCVNDFGQYHKPEIVVLAPPIYVLECWV